MINKQSIWEKVGYKIVKHLKYNSRWRNMKQNPWSNKNFNCSTNNHLSTIKLKFNLKKLKLKHKKVCVK